MSTAATYLITAAAGNIGTELIPLLLNDPSRPTLILPTSNANRLSAKLPHSDDEPRVKVLEGDITDPTFVQDTCTKYSVTAVFLCLTSEAELFVTMNFLDALKRSPTVKHLVYLSACGDFSLSAIEKGVLTIANAGHVVVKFIVEAKLKYGLVAPEQGGMTYTIIGPTLFFSNDLRSKKSLLEKGVFDEPIGSKGVSRVHPADIALAANNALIDGGKTWHGKKVMIGSRKLFTNEDIGKLWTEKLGKEVKVVGSDEKSLNAFEEHISAVKNSMWGRDMRLMYEIFEQMGFGMSDEEYAEQLKLLGKEPEDYEKWVAGVVEEWKKEV